MASHDSSVTGVFLSLSLSHWIYCSRKQILPAKMCWPLSTAERTGDEFDLKVTTICYKRAGIWTRNSLSFRAHPSGTTIRGSGRPQNITTHQHGGSCFLPNQCASPWQHTETRHTQTKTFIFLYRFPCDRTHLPGQGSSSQIARCPRWVEGGICFNYFHFEAGKG